MTPPRPGGTPDPERLEALRRAISETGGPSPRPRRRAGRPDGPADDPEVHDVRDPDDGPWWASEPPAKPIRVKGGIAARTRRGAIGSTWWSRRFLESIEAVVAGGRLERGRSYARRGQVLSLDIGPGVVEAAVQGSRRSPYKVRLTLPVVPEEDWDAVAVALGAQAGYAARMLAGDLPAEVEDVFSAQGTSLLPGPHARLSTACTCPDWENPCKHVAAVCYLLAEEFDREPFSLLRWRGRDREVLLRALRAVRVGSAAAPVAAVQEASRHPRKATRAPEPARVRAADDLEKFWAAGQELAGVHVRPELVPSPGGILRQVARGVLFVGEEDLADALGSTFRRIAEGAARRALTADDVRGSPSAGTTRQKGATRSST